MDDQRPYGRRRLDRVLSDEFSADLPNLPISDVRARRGEAEQEEADLSYLRRLLQGRIDILRAELGRRSGGGSDTVVDRLAEVLSGEPPASPHGLGRNLVVDPTLADRQRRRVESLVADIDLDDLPARTDDELRSALDVYLTEERAVSIQRRSVQRVMDLCGAEIARRYASGTADHDEVGRLVRGDQR